MMIKIKDLFNSNLFTKMKRNDLVLKLKKNINILYRGGWLMMIQSFLFVCFFSAHCNIRVNPHNEMRL